MTSLMAETFAGGFSWNFATWIAVAVLATTTVVAASVPGFAAEDTKADFYVAPNGNDDWSGRLAEPSRDGTDGPFESLARAQEAVRELRRREPDRKTPVRVLIRGGVYYLPETLTFTPADSGTAESPTIYAAYPREVPVLSGGTRLTGWRQTPDGRWQVHLPEVERGEWDFCQLWVNGERR
ncbi:MAG: hypothetical protein N2512_15100, partial [Armatimonadetes bacterium]|nr:hypothetical protein [Armatimonadota bacterium]